MSPSDTPSGEAPRKGWFSRLFGGDTPTENTPPPPSPEETMDLSEAASEEPPVPVMAKRTEEPVPSEDVFDASSAPVADPLPEPSLPPPVPIGASVDPALHMASGPVVGDTVLPTEPESVVEPMEPAEETAAEEPVKKNWMARLKEGLGRSTSRLGKGITDLFTKRKLDDEALEDLEDLLITADLGVETAHRVAQRLSKARFGQEVTPEEIREALAEEVAEILEPVAVPLVPDPSCKPFVVLVAGVNGSGKTTTIGKLAKYYRDQGLSVSLAAGDTFRAAAVEQLKVWGERTKCPVIARDQGADAAGLAFDALTEAQKRGDDLLLIDTAGRLQNKKDLMAELQKIIRVLQKKDPDTPHATILVLDATVGQNAHSQVETFKDMVNVTGLVLTKLDGTARGGVLVALAERFGLPVHAIGVGESADDLRPFDARTFARSLTGVE